MRPEDLVGFAIAHEVRGLLTPARAQLELAIASGHSSVAAALRAIDRVLEFADAILVARPGATCDLADAAVGAISTLPPNGSEVLLDIEPGTPVGMPQPLLERVIANLVLNAIQAMASRPGCVTLHSFAWNDRWRLQITDTGPGIPRATVAASRGRGIQICAFLVKHAGGELIIDQRPGQGTTVTLDLPRPVQQQAAA